MIFHKFSWKTFSRVFHIVFKRRFSENSNTISRNHTLKVSRYSPVVSEDLHSDCKNKQLFLMFTAQLQSERIIFELRSVRSQLDSNIDKQIEVYTRKLKQFIIEDLKPAIKSEIEGKLITDVNHAVSDVKVTVLAELLKCKSEIYELKERQLRLHQKSL